MELLDQAPTLIGVVIGALSTILATSLSERLSWRRAQAVKWDEARFESYARFAQALKEMTFIAGRLTADRRHAVKSTPVERSVGLQLLADAAGRRSEAWETVLLMGDAATISAGRDWSSAVMELDQMARGTEDVTETWLAFRRRADACRDRYYEVARKSLGVRGGFAPNPDTTDAAG